MEVERTAAVDPSQEAAALPGRGGRWLSPQQVGTWQFQWPPTVDNWSSETFRCSGTAAGTKPSELSPPVSVGSAGEPFASTQGECLAQRRGNTSPPATAKQRPSVGAFCGALLADGAAPACGDEALAQGAAPAYGAMPTECAAQADVATLAVAPAKVAAPANIASSADATAPSDSAASDAAGEAKR